MSKLNKPINVVLNGTVVSFDEPDNSYVYDIYIDNNIVHTINSERQPRFIGMTPATDEEYVDSVVVRPTFDVPIAGIELEYSLDNSNWISYADDEGVTLQGTDDGNVDVWFRGTYVLTGVSITPSLIHATYDVIKSYNISYGTINPKEGEYTLKPTKCYARYQKEFSVKALVDTTITPYKSYYITNVSATNCTLIKNYNADYTLGSFIITNPTGDVRVSVALGQSNIDDHDVTVSNGTFSPDPFNCVYYQLNTLNVFPNEDYALPKREDIHITGANSGEEYEYNYIIGEGTDSYAILTFIPQDEPCEIIITCNKLIGG